jgi:hypothetical protein
MRLAETSFRHGLSGNVKRRLLFVVTAVAVTLLLAITAAFVQARRARTGATRYIRVVTPLRIGTPYDLVVAQLRDADIATTCLSGDRPHECTLVFRFNNKWQYRLHLAPPAELVGQLEFRDESLVQKSTVLGRDVCCWADVLESASTTSRTTANVDSSGRTWKISVEVSALDFTEYRKQAYAFNLACIGSMRGCKTDEYLPTVNDLERTGSK